MDSKIARRDFLKAVPVTAYALAQAAEGITLQSPPAAGMIKIEPFDYDGVRLLEGRWQQQYQEARDFYLGVSDDDILHGYRQAAGLPAPGKPLGGWCARNSNTVFGQWLSGMSRFAKAGNDSAMRDKVVKLFTEWAKTVKPDGNCGMNHYPYEKLVCGLVDMQLYLDYTDTTEMLGRVTDWAVKNFDRTRTPAGPVPWEMHSGQPLEWYTVGENLFRAYELTGDTKFKDFAEVWLYTTYWNKFGDNPDPKDAAGVHAYSHVNTFSSAAMAYAVNGDQHYLNVIRNAYDFLQKRQCYATGGYGPSERIMPSGGHLGQALNYHQNSCETPCGSWAAFKLGRYLTQFTGEARYGDWMERLLYNGVGAALRIQGAGRHFYYADYRVAGGVKVFARDVYTCCSGTYCQGVADYPNLIYYKDPASLYVSLYVPSEVTWKRAGGDVKVTQETRYPEAEKSTFTVTAKDGTQFAMKFRVPGWSQGMTIAVNGEPAKVDCQPGNWAVLDRAWKSGDKVDVTIPLSMRYSAVDEAHPHRIAVVRGPVVLVQEGNAHEPVFKLPDTEEELNHWLVASGDGYYRMVPPDGTTVRARFLPFYDAVETLAYRMYFDNDKLPDVLW